nr:MAG: hypothetical protein DIU78_07985 [Pseudomonadota bacterium]
MLLGMLVGCDFGPRLVTSRAEYTAYRDVRTASGQLERLAASHRYLTGWPEGQYRAEVEAWFRRAEPEFVKQAHDRPSLLRAYLRALPDGPHAPDVRRRLDELEILREYRARSVEREERRIRDAQRELEEASTARRALVGTMVELVGSLAKAREFGAPASAFAPEIAKLFTPKAPNLVCTASACVRSQAIPYGVPEGLRIVRRTARFELVALGGAERVERLVLAGPRLFDRIGEALDTSVAGTDGLAARVEAISRSVQLIENAIEAELPAAECAKHPVAPIVLLRECRGVRFVARAAEDERGDDRIEIVGLASSARTKESIKSGSGRPRESRGP